MQTVGVVIALVGGGCWIVANLLHLAMEGNNEVSTKEAETFFGFIGAAGLLLIIVDFIRRPVLSPVATLLLLLAGVMLVVRLYNWLYGNRAAARRAAAFSESSDPTRNEICGL